jgi:hypothetical protein
LEQRPRRPVLSLTTCEDSDVPLNHIIQQESNARINAAEHNKTSIQVQRMKAALFPLALNELLGFVGLHHSRAPEPSALIVSSNLSIAAWRFNSAQHQPESLCEAHIIQYSLAFKNFYVSQEARLNDSVLILKRSTET